MKLDIDDYAQFLVAVNAFGQSGPVFTYVQSGATFVAAFVHGGVVLWNGGTAPATLATDFPSALNVNFSQLASFY